MRPPSINRLLLAATQLSWTARAQLITITRTNYLCSFTTTLSYPTSAASSSVLSAALSSTYSSISQPSLPPSSSPTLSTSSPVSIQATSFSSTISSATPTNSIDAAISNGAPFVIVVNPIGRSTKKKRQQSGPSWISPSGYTTTDYSQAAVFQISQGALYANQLQYSTWPNVPNETFAGYMSDSVGPITTFFSSVNGSLTWTYSSFQGPGNTAEFFVSPPGEADGAQVVAWFYGEVGQDWSQIGTSANLTGGSASTQGVQPSTNFVGTASFSYSFLQGTSISPYSRNTNTATNTINYNPSGLPVSGDGTCGVGNGDTSCWRSGYGPCCAEGGFCGYPGSGACSAGCQAAYGSCSAMSVPSSSTAGSAPSSSSMSAATPTVTSTIGTCGLNGNTVVVCPNATNPQFGPCCNIYGECASDPFSCSQSEGCQPEYGICSWSSSSSSSQQSSTSIGAASTLSASSLALSLPSSSYSSTTVVQSTVVVSPSPSSSYSSIAVLSSTVVVSPSPGSSAASSPSPSMSSPPMSPSQSPSTTSTQSSTAASLPITSASSMMSSSTSSIHTSSQIPPTTTSSSTSTSQSPTVIQSACTNLATPIACPTSNESFYDNFIIECGINYASSGNMPGTGSYQPLTMELCIQNCSGTPGCVGVDWATGPKNCYLKASIGTRSSNAGVIGAYLPNPAVICVGSQLGVSSSSNLIGSTASVVSSSTVVLSSTTSSPFSLPTTSFQIFNTTSTSSTTTAGASSAVSGCPMSATYTDPTTGDVFNVEQGTGYSGNNLTAPVNVTNFSICASLCANSTGMGCVAAIWLSGSPVGLCYLKTALGSGIARPNACGAILQNAPTGTVSTISVSSTTSSPPTSSIQSSTQSPPASSSISASSSHFSSSSSTTSIIFSSSTSSTTSSAPTSTSAFKPSPNSKRGLVYVSDGFNSQDDPIWVQGGSDLNWYYNYGYTPMASYAVYPQLQFVPMLWGDFNSTFTQTVISMIEMGVNVSYVMSFNEPDGTFSTGGSQVSPQRAAARWMTDIAPLGAYGVQLGAPAVAGNEGGFQWLQQFFTYCNGSCNASFLSVHWYGSFQGLASKLGQASATYPNMTLWVTEFADSYDTLANSQTTASQDFSYLDRLSNVVRYSYFGSFRSSESNVGTNATMLDQCGRLTQIGNQYLNLTGPAYIPYATPCNTSSSATPSSTSSSMYTSPNTVSTSTTYSPTSFVQPSSIPNPSQQTSTPSPYLGPQTTSSTASTTSSSVSAAPSATSSSSTYCPAPTSYPYCQPPTASLHLPGPPTTVPNMGCNTTTDDDDYGVVCLPFAIILFGVSSTVANPSTNGLLSLVDGTTSFGNVQLPATFPDPLVQAVAYPLWCDLAITANTTQGIYYWNNATYVMFEWILAASCCPNLIARFSMGYDSLNAPGVVTFNYYQVFDSGGSATVGAQGSQQGPDVQWDYDGSTLVPAGTTVVCDTNVGSCSSSTFSCPGASC